MAHEVEIRAENEDEIRQVLEALVRAILPNSGARISKITVSEDSTGGHVLLVEVKSRRNFHPSRANAITYQAREKLIELGKDDLFPMFRYVIAHNENHAH